MSEPAKVIDLAQYRKAKAARALKQVKRDDELVALIIADDAAWDVFMDAINRRKP